jgi:hypothetical protein
MSMYAQILDTVIEGRPRPETAPTTTEKLWELARCRARLNAMDPFDRRRDWAPAALANQIAYDVALIELAGCVGIACDSGTFDQPEVRRAELNRELADRGIDVNAVDEKAGNAAPPY